MVLIFQLQILHSTSWQLAWINIISYDCKSLFCFFFFWFFLYEINTLPVKLLKNRSTRYINTNRKRISSWHRMVYEFIHFLFLHVFLIAGSDLWALTFDPASWRIYHKASTSQSPMPDTYIYLSVHTTFVIWKIVYLLSEKIVYSEIWRRKNAIKANTCTILQAATNTIWIFFIFLTLYFRTATTEIKSTSFIPGIAIIFYRLQVHYEVLKLDSSCTYKSAMNE